MNWMILGGMAVVLILFVWSWIGFVMLHHLTLARRLEKLLNIENPLPEEEKELKHLKEMRTIEGSKIRSAKWTLLVTMALLLAAVVFPLFSDVPRALLGIQTLTQAIWIAIAGLAFFCMPTYMGLVLASFSTRNMEKEKERKTQGAA